jgi:phage terminase small subunit
MNNLNPKQIRFIEEYLIDNNGSAAAVRSGYSEKTAKEQASRLLTNVNIRAEIEKRRNETSKKLEIKKEDILNQQNAINKAFETLLELSLKDKLTSQEEMKFGRLMMVVKAADSTRASEFLAKHLGWDTADDSNDFEFKFNIIKKNKDDSGN